MGADLGVTLSQGRQHCPISRSQLRLLEGVKQAAGDGGPGGACLRGQVTHFVMAALPKDGQGCNPYLTALLSRISKDIMRREGSTLFEY